MRVLKQIKIDYNLAPDSTSATTEIEVVGSYVSVENVQKTGDSEVEVVITTQSDNPVARINTVGEMRGFLLWPTAKVYITTRGGTIGANGYVYITQYEEG